MTFQIIIKGKERHHKLGKTRSEQEQNLRKEWGFTISDEQLDKLKFIEKKNKEQTGSKKNFVGGHLIDEVGRIKSDPPLCIASMSAFAKGYDAITRNNGWKKN